MDHTADVGVEIEAGDLAELFAAALDALVDIMLASPPERADESREIRLAAASLDGLLVRWLEEWIFLIHSSRRVPVDADIEIVEDDGWRLAATVRDAPLDPDRHGWKGEVKGATYHGLDVRRHDGGWRASIVFDV
jgi:SHS2 domain-containing protein